MDAYQIDIDDRIVLSTNITTNAAANGLLAGLGLPQVTAFSYFTNGMEPRTRGVDAVSSYTLPLAASSLELTAAYSYNETEVKTFLASPAVFDSLGITQFARSAATRSACIQDSYPRDKAILSGTWRSDRWELGRGHPRRQLHRAQLGHRRPRPDLRCQMGARRLGQLQAQANDGS